MPMNNLLHFFGFLIYLQCETDFVCNFVAECESLIRKMLVLAPEKRFTVEQVKKHRWMVAEGPPRLLPSSNQPSGEPNEQILRLMQSLGIDAAKTKEVKITETTLII